MHESCPTLYIISGTGQGSLLYYIIYYYCIYHHGRTDRIIGWSSMQAAATIISGRAFHIAAACRRDAPAPATNEVAAFASAYICAAVAAKAPPVEVPAIVGASINGPHILAFAYTVCMNTNVYVVNCIVFTKTTIK